MSSSFQTLDNLDLDRPDHTPNTTSKEAPVMTTTLDRPLATDTTSAAPGAVVSTEHDSRVTLARAARSEWIKFRTVRSNLVAVGAAMAAAIGFGALFSSLAGSDDGPGSFATDGLSLSLAGFNLSQIIVAILGVALVANEYQSGLIRTWFGSAPDRLRVLVAKIGVYGTVLFGASLVAGVIAFLAGQALLPAGFTALTLGSDGVMQALLGTAFYMACIGVIGVGLGFLLRSTAAGAGAVVTMLMIAPIMIGLLPASISDPLARLLPSNAASAVQGVESNIDLLSAGWGIAVLLAWVLAIGGSAAVALKRRDA